jgi:hypothetical protein
MTTTDAASAMVPGMPGLTKTVLSDAAVTAGGLVVLLLASLIGLRVRRQRRRAGRGARTAPVSPALMSMPSGPLAAPASGARHAKPGRDHRPVAAMPQVPAMPGGRGPADRPHVIPVPRPAMRTPPTVPGQPPWEPAPKPDSEPPELWRQPSEPPELWRQPSEPPALWRQPSEPPAPAAPPVRGWPPARHDGTPAAHGFIASPVPGPDQDPYGAPGSATNPFPRLPGSAQDDGSGLTGSSPAFPAGHDEFPAGPGQDAPARPATGPLFVWDPAALTDPFPAVPPQPPGAPDAPGSGDHDNPAP